MANASRLSDLAASRLCHDLVGPAGAVAAGLELLDDPSDMDPEAMDLIRMSAAQLNSRLAFFRLAFGRADSGMVRLAEVRRILESFHSESVEVEWHPPVDLVSDSVPRIVARVLLLASMVAQSAILRNSSLSTRIAGAGDGVALGVLAEGQGGRMDDAMQRVLAGDLQDDDYVPAMLPAILLAILCSESGFQMQFEAREGETEIAVLCGA
jgi:histidine phosphotransferase ChpT